MYHETPIHLCTPDDLEQFMKQHQGIKDREKKQFGEVFTPPSLVRRIFTHFPNECFSNPNAKWFDPTAGVGHFVVILYIKLMSALESWEPHKEKRSQHIISKMLFLNELNRANCDILRGLFGIDANISCNDALTLDTGREKYDYIIGNPPFQYCYGTNVNGRRIRGGKGKLYEHIFVHSYSMLKTDGVMAFIAPDRLFEGNKNSVYALLLSSFVPFVSFDPANTRAFGKIQQPVCFFILPTGS